MVDRSGWHVDDASCTGATIPASVWRAHQSFNRRRAAERLKGQTPIASQWSLTLKFYCQVPGRAVVQAPPRSSLYDHVARCPLSNDLRVRLEWSSFL